MAAPGDLDRQVRGLDAPIQDPQEEESQQSCLERLLAEAVDLLNQAENEVKIRQNKVLELQNKLDRVLETKKQEITVEKKEENMQNKIKSLEEESPKEESKKEITTNKEDESKRKAEVRRKWRVLGMKVRVGVTANVVRRRKVNDANTFIDKETEAVAMEDNLDLEGKCERKKAVRSKWRKAGVMVGTNQGRDLAF